MDSGLTAYVVGYLAACMLAALVAAIERRRLLLLSPNSRLFLCAPRKLVTFSLAAAVLSFAFAHFAFAHLVQFNGDVQMAMGCLARPPYPTTQHHSFHR